MKSRLAFTLLELVLAVAIIALLIVLLSPVLGRMKSLGTRAKTLSNLRSTATILHAYTNDWKSSWPDFVNPRATVSYIRLPTRGYVHEVHMYFASAWEWPFALSEGYYGGDPFSTSIYPAEQRAGDITNNVFSIPCTFFADPQFWKDETRTGPNQYRGTFSHEVSFPGQKSLLVSYFGFHGYSSYPPTNPPDSKIPMALVDGHVQDTPRDQILPGHRTGENDLRHGLHLSAWPPGAHTIDGLRGRDVP